MDDEGRGPPAVMLEAMHPFEVMAEPVRRRLVDVLASGEHTSGQLAEVIGAEFRVSRTAVSKHLRVMRDAGFVDVRADQRFRWYRLTSKGIDVLEYAVEDVRAKIRCAIGWDAENNREFDPVRLFTRAVRRRGPGPTHRRGVRGRQRSAPHAADPDAGLYRVYAPPD